MTTYLKYLLETAQNELNETYETALENSFKYYLDETEQDNTIEAKKEFESSEYYFLNVDDFFKSKAKAINSIREDAQKELIKSIDALSIEELRQSKLIYNQIIRIFDTVTQPIENDCELVTYL